MSAEKIKTYYPTVEHLDSFWEAVWGFEALKDSEGVSSAKLFMTNCVMCSAARGYLADCPEHPRSTSAQDRAFHALRDFVCGPDVTGIPDREAIAFGSVWETAGV